MGNMNGNRAKKPVLSEEQVQANRKKTAQQWLPIADVSNHTAYRKDKLLIGMLRVQPLNLELLSKNEKRRKIEALAEELNGEREDIQIFCIGRPVDLNTYLEWLQDKAKNENDFNRRRVLRGYIQVASQMASSGETIERRFYIIIVKEAGPKAEFEIHNRLMDLKNKISAAELQSEICQEDELMDVYALFASPVQASFEKATTEYHLPTLLEL